jgi:hypothetical protein
VIFAVGPGKTTTNIIWTGSDDGLVHVTRDGGKSWTNVTPKGMPEFGRVSQIDASRFNPGAAYVSVRRPLLGDEAPYIFRTTDYGRSWTKVVQGIRPDAYVHAVREDPTRRGLLYAATQHGVYVSYDDGGTWQDLSLTMPDVPVADLIVEKNELVIATHGRGFWVLDDIGSLRQLTNATAQSTVVLFKPTDALAIVQGGDNGTPWQKDEPQAENAPVGAVIDYYLKSAASGPVVIDILDASGKVVRSYSSATPVPATTAPQTVSALWVRPPATVPTSAGMHRWIWDLREPPAQGGRGGGGGGGFGRQQPMLTGSFTVRLTANGQTLNQPLVVKPDPRAK